MPPAICIASVGYIRTAFSFSSSASGAVAAKEHGLDCLALLPLHLSRRVVVVGVNLPVKRLKQPVLLFNSERAHLVKLLQKIFLAHGVGCQL